MGPLVVEHGAPLVEACLLALHILIRGACGLGLECFVHPLVGTVLLRLAGLDALMVDAPFDPPY